MGREPVAAIADTYRDSCHLDAIIRVVLDGFRPPVRRSLRSPLVESFTAAVSPRALSNRRFR